MIRELRMTAVCAVFGLVGAVLLIMLVWAPRAWVLRAQQAERLRPWRETKVWLLQPNNRALPSAGTILVLDTEGVCLYLYERSWSGGGFDTSDTLAGALVAVPKTQLPQGTGCQ